MEYTYDSSGEFFVFMGLAIIVLFFLFAIYFNIIVPLMKEREYIKMEMQRSFNEEAYRYWKKELKRAYLRHIPFIGRFYGD